MMILYKRVCYVGVLIATLIHLAGAFCVSNALYQQLTDGCPSTELSQLCSSYLSGQAIVSTTIVVSTTVLQASYLTPSKTKTLGRTSTSVIITVTSSFTQTLTYTQADKTVTTPGCKPTITCGAATITNSFGPLTEACSCLYVTTSTSTIYSSETLYFPIVYKTTHTNSLTDRFTVYSTTHPIVTTRVPTLVSHKCSSVAPPVQTCSNTQVQIAVYYPGGESPPNFDMYKTEQPSQNYSGYPPSEAVRLNPRTGYYYQCSGELLIMRGYIYAPQTGQYNWTIAAVGQSAWTWFDHLAYSGWNNTNRYLYATNKLHGFGPSRSIFWKAGTYHPFRLAWFCDTNPNDLYYHMRRPDGKILFGYYEAGVGLAPDEYVNYPRYELDDYGEYDDYYQFGYGFGDLNEVDTNYLVQYGCGGDAKLAPPYPDWGHET